jgi:glucoamylase
MNRQVRSVPAGGLLRIVASSPFVLHWTDDGWATVQDSGSTPTSVGIEYVDINVKSSQAKPVRFTFYWPLDRQWQDKNYRVEVAPPAQNGPEHEKGGNG